MSINYSGIAFTLYAVSDMSRARAFYEGVLQLQPTMVFGEPGGFQWVEYDIGTGTLALGSGAPEWKPGVEGGTVALEVENFDDAVAALRSAQVKFRVEPMTTPVCRMAGFYDTEGNSLMIHRRNSPA